MATPNMCRVESILEKAGQQISAMQAYEQTDLAMLSALALSAQITGLRKQRPSENRVGTISAA